MVDPILTHLKMDIKFQKEAFSKEETEMINEIFGLFVKNIYFKLDINEVFNKDDRLINFFGISGAGKTLIKDHLKDTVEKHKNDNIKILDFDSITREEWLEHQEKNIIELLNITSADDEILRIVAGFGLFEMRILLTKIKLLSQGQQTRLKYIYLLNQIDFDKQNYIFIDEYLTFVDSLSGISFAKTMAKYLKNKPVFFYSFGVNDALIGQGEDITYVLGNAGISGHVRDGEVHHNDDYITRPKTHELGEW